MIRKTYRDKAADWEAVYQQIKCYKDSRQKQGAEAFYKWVKTAHV